MMLDITGSMSGQKLTDLKTSASDLINIVVWKDQSKFTSKVAIVPFSEDMRMPNTTALNKARGTSLPATTRRLAPAVPKDDLLSVRLRGGTHRHAEVHRCGPRLRPIRDGALHDELDRAAERVCAASQPAPRSSIEHRQDFPPSPKSTTSRLVGARQATSAPRGPGTPCRRAGRRCGREHPRCLRDRQVAEDRDPDDRRRVQHAVQLQRHLGKPECDPTCPRAANGCSTTQARALCTAMKAGHRHLHSRDSTWVAIRLPSTR